MINRRQFPLHASAPAFAAAWVLIIAGASVALSTVFACITPFVALATVSVIMLPRRMALFAVLLAWLANQMVGYFILGYPRNWDSYAWGIAIGFAALVAFLAATLVTRAKLNAFLAWVAAFAAALVAYEGILFAATAFLPSGDGAFSLSIIAKVVLINLVAAAGLVCLNGIAAIARILVVRPALHLAR
ncbi:hypothetical protein FBZ99_11879 [Rhizobium sp. ERR 1071]|uniref:hypothetical protein n=1 Tax=Rhizobium sp. ERR 1071 TaxID=2572677 RepID=UPI00119B71BF|nr:hypothetical protein [Rhizobium sp. ERR1071]TWB08773.1 hypothetical protein FBZ99_11879 [Rhizobium sp. ERR1071]